MTQSTYPPTLGTSGRLSQGTYTRFVLQAETCPTQPCSHVRYPRRITTGSAWARMSELFFAKKSQSQSSSTCLENDEILYSCASYQLCPPNLRVGLLVQICCLIVLTDFLSDINVGVCVRFLSDFVFHNFRLLLGLICTSDCCIGFCVPDLFSDILV